MLQEPAKSLDGVVGAETADDIAAYASMVVHAEQFLIRAGAAPAEARSQVLSAEPFNRFRELLLSYFDKAKAKAK
jgi:hypothetical protein